MVLVRMVPVLEHARKRTFSMTKTNISNTICWLFKNYPISGLSGSRRDIGVHQRLHDRGVRDVEHLHLRSAIPVRPQPQAVG